MHPAEKELIRRALAEKSIRHYVDYSFKDYVFGEWHSQFFDALDRVERGELKRLMVFTPPKVGKSEIISKQFPAFCLGKDSTREIVVSSYAAEIAAGFGRKTRDIILSQDFKNAFPNFKLSDVKKEGHNWETSKGGSLYSVGVGGALTSRGFDIGIIDDPVKDRQDAESITIQQRTWDWYTSVFRTRRKNLSNSSIILVMTRWHTEDLAGRILEMSNMFDEKWEIICFPALNEKEESFFPERFTSEEYKNERKQIEASGNIKDWYALYMQDPIKSMGATFKEEDFRYYNLSDFETKMNKSDFEVSIICDPAFSSNTSSDDCVVMAIARNRTSNQIYVLDIWADTQPPSISIAQIFNFAEKWKAFGFNIAYLSVEEVSLSKDQRLFVKQVDDTMKDKGLIYTLLRYSPKGKKEDRIKFTLEPYFNRNVIFFRNDDNVNGAWRKLRTQLLKFPASAHDDVIDTLTQGIEMIGKRRVNNPMQQRELKEKHRELRTKIKTMRKTPVNLYR